MKSNRTVKEIRRERAPYKKSFHRPKRTMQLAGKFKRGKRTNKDHATSQKMKASLISKKRNKSGEVGTKYTQNKKGKTTSLLLLLVVLNLFRFRCSDISLRKSSRIEDISVTSYERMAQRRNLGAFDRPINLLEKNRRPFRLTLQGRVSGRVKGTVGHHLLRHLAKAMLDCSSDLQDHENVVEVRQSEDWDQFTEDWLKNIRKDRVAIISLMEDEDGRVGSLTVGDLFENLIVVPVKYYMGDSGVHNLGEYIEQALPELHEVLRDRSVTKVVSSPHLAKLLLRSNEREEVLYPVVDPVSCASARTPQNFATHPEEGGGTTGFGLKAMVWTYLGEQNGPYEEHERGFGGGKSAIKRWPNVIQKEYSEEQLVWTLEVVHASKLSVLDYLSHFIRDHEEEADLAYFGQVVVQTLERQILQGQQNIQYWGRVERLERGLDRGPRARLFGRRDEIERREKPRSQRRTEVDPLERPRTNDVLERDRKRERDDRDNRVQGRSPRRSREVSPQRSGQRSGACRYPSPQEKETRGRSPRQSREESPRSRRASGYSRDRSRSYRWSPGNAPDLRDRLQELERPERSEGISRKENVKQRLGKTTPERADCSKDIRDQMKITPEQQRDLERIKIQLKQAGKLHNRDYLKKFNVCYDCARPAHKDQNECEYPAARRAWIKDKKYYGLTLPCLRCLEGDHIADVCPFVNHICGHCFKPGHFAAECHVLDPRQWFLMHLKFCQLGLCTRLNQGGIFGGAYGYGTSTYEEDPALSQILFAKQRSLRLIRENNVLEIIDSEGEEVDEEKNANEQQNVAKISEDDAVVIRDERTGTVAVFANSQFAREEVRRQDRVDAERIQNRQEQVEVREGPDEPKDQEDEPMEVQDEGERNRDKGSHSDTAENEEECPLEAELAAEETAGMEVNESEEQGAVVDSLAPEGVESDSDCIVVDEIKTGSKSASGDRNANDISSLSEGEQEAAQHEGCQRKKGKTTKGRKDSGRPGQPQTEEREGRINETRRERKGKAKKKSEQVTTDPSTAADKPLSEDETKAVGDQPKDAVEGDCSTEAGELQLSEVEEALAEDLTERDDEDIAKECAEFNI